jgi:hypothetical protein
VPLGCLHPRIRELLPLSRKGREVIISPASVLVAQSNQQFVGIGHGIYEGF